MPTPLFSRRFQSYSKAQKKLSEKFGRPQSPVSVFSKLEIVEVKFNWLGSMKGTPSAGNIGTLSIMIKQIIRELFISIILFWLGVF
jgi:hypothetical protein